MSDSRQTVRPRAARAVDVVIVGAGHSGLAMSRCLAERSIDHVIVERGEIANAWRHERWDSLHLLTPNWQASLPACGYSGPDPDGFMAMPDVVEFIERYATQISAPVVTGTEVTSVRQSAGTYRVETTRGSWNARAIVAASGAFSQPVVPAVAAALPASLAQWTSRQYRNPDQLDAGGVLIVGASATGLQLADEIQRTGRPVTLAVGEHIRMPRRYRGRDVQWWLSAAGVLDQKYTEVEDINRARRVPSPQLIGSVQGRTLDLNILQDIGVRLAGRLVGMSGSKAQFSGSLANHCAMADLKLNRLLGTFDDWASERGLDAQLPTATRPLPTQVAAKAPLMFDLHQEGIRTVLWATGLAPDYGWLELPVFDRRGRIRHDGGVVASGVYIMGLPFMRRRKSSYMHGAEDDARELSAHLAGHLHSQGRCHAA